MSDELKDFRYYADKAEALLDGMTNLAEDDNEGATIITAMAAVFAELAKAAPKAGLGWCSNNWNAEDATYVCSRGYGHEGPHQHTGTSVTWAPGVGIDPWKLKTKPDWMMKDND
jgi:hypothetical protein